MQPPVPPADGSEPAPWQDYPRALRYVAAGGGAGAAARWGLLQAVDPAWTSATVAAINVAGSIVLGVLVGLRRTRSGRRRLTGNQLLLLGGGFCGAFTTFSTYALEVASALDEGDLSRAAAVGLGTAAAAVVGGGLGYRLGSRP